MHAPSATPDGEGGVVVLFNMNPGKPTQGWNQIMTLPRCLTVLDRDALAIEPAGDIDTAAVDSLKALDPNRPIREADITLRFATTPAEKMELHGSNPGAPTIQWKIEPVSTF